MIAKAIAPFGVVFVALLAVLLPKPLGAQAQSTDWEIVSETERSCTTRTVEKRRVVGAYELTLTEIDADCEPRVQKLDIRPVEGVLGIRRVLLSYESTWLAIDDAMLGQDISGAGHPYLAVTTCGGGAVCDTSFFLVEFGKTARELINIQLGRGEAELVPIAGTAHWALRIREHWPSDSCLSCGAYPVSYLRHDGDRFVASPELMRAPPPDAAGLTDEVDKLRAADDRAFDDALTDVFARMVYGGNLAAACSIFERAWPTDRSNSHRAEALEGLLAQFARPDEETRIPGLAKALAALNAVAPNEKFRC